MSPMCLLKAISDLIPTSLDVLSCRCWNVKQFLLPPWGQSHWCVSIYFQLINNCVCVTVTVLQRNHPSGFITPFLPGMECHCYTHHLGRILKLTRLHAIVWCPCRCTIIEWKFGWTWKPEYRWLGCSCSVSGQCQCFWRKYCQCNCSPLRTSASASFQYVLNQ